MNTSRKHIAIRVYGKVHGVFFRASTRDKAKELGVTGFVQNEPDGTVYLEAEGEAAALKQLEQWTHEGPGRARVEKVEVQELEQIADFREFEVRR
ncbi:acylphosphatase [Pontibacter sp. SGAir0037]|uniref:acylphosphatase n=1 Tax=Pontibacter sp. SGAir0037 TaxID=2571030 RepID=UPI0010CD4707|nr:acylphosphatase [Pontibacter sp. SGAir0037]QCR24215.1 acylphosphatase [Pontibacter sp. SGAir0037]